MNRMIIICAAAASLASAALVSTEASAKGGKGFKHGGGYALKHHGGHWGHGNWGHGHYRWRHRRHIGFSDYGCWRRYWTPYGVVRRNVCVVYY